MRGVFSSLTTRRPAAGSAAAELTPSTRGPLAALAIAALASSGPPGPREGGGDGGGLGGAILAGTGRMRLARALLGAYRLVGQSYDEAEAVGWHCLLHSSELAECAGEPLLCCVTAAAASSVLVLTDMRLVCVDARPPHALSWQVLLRDLVALEATSDHGIRIVQSDPADAGELQPAVHVHPADVAAASKLLPALRAQVEQTVCVGQG